MNIPKITSNSTQRQTNFGINPVHAESLKALSVRIAKLPETDAVLGEIIIQRLQNKGFPRIEADSAKPRDFLIRQFNLLYDQREAMSQRWPERDYSMPNQLAEKIDQMSNSVGDLEYVIDRRSRSILA